VFYYFRGSLQLLVEVLDAAGETDEADQIRTGLPHLLMEPDGEDYAMHRAEFEALLPVVRAVE
jgi:hypothetical protein